jgi:lactoylglutathione lyase
MPFATRKCGSMSLLPAVVLLYASCVQQGPQPEPPRATPAKSAQPKGRVLGIGGVFFKTANRDQMQNWYAERLGLKGDGGGVMLPWRDKDDPSQQHFTVWSLFPGDTKYFAPSTAPFMINYIVDDLDAMIEKLKKADVKIDPKRQEEPYGRFAWIYDPDGNKIELWQPLTPPDGAQ